MKRNQLGSARKILAILIGLILGTVLFSTAVLAESDTAGSSGSTEVLNLTSDSNATGEEIFNQLTQLGEPEDYDESSLAHPYGYGNNTVALNKKSSVLHLYTAKKYSGDWGEQNANDTVALFNQYKSGDCGPSDNWTKVYYNQWNSGASEFRGLSFIQAVAFDPDGTGLRNKVALIGVQNNNTENHQFHVQVWLLNVTKMQTGSKDYIEDKYDLGYTAKWMSTKNGDVNFLEWTEGRNGLSITAGDYNADGKDTLVIYVKGDNEYGLMEFSASSGKLTKKGDLSKKQLAAASADSLASGDVNHDSIDDLAVVSTANGSELKTLLSVSFGKDDPDSAGILNENNRSLYLTRGENQSITDSGVDIGQVCLDNYQKIVVAGYNTSGSSVDRRNQTLFIVDANQNNELKIENFNNVSTYSNLREVKEYGWAKGNVLVACAAVDGPGKQEKIYVNGTICTMLSTGAVNCDNSASDSAFDSSKKRGYQLANVYAGNVNGDLYGFEEFTVSYYDTYGAGETILFGNASYKKDGEDMTFTASGNLTSKGSEWFKYDDLSVLDFYHGVNQLMIPVETDKNDALRAKLDHKGYFYSNPQVVAVLQAAPYFKEFSGTAGTTTYSTTLSYIMGEGKTKSNYFGAGFAQSSSFMDSGESLRQSFNVIFKDSSSYDFKTQKKDAYTTTFTATNKDTVIMRVLPIFYYSYSTYNEKNDQWIGGGGDMGIMNAQPPKYLQITVDQYNSYVEYYNKWIEDHKCTIDNDGKPLEVKAQPLNQINKDDYKLGNEGNPAGYASSWSQIAHGTKASKGSMVLPYNGSSMTSNYGYETSTTETHSTSNSFDISFNIQYGNKAKDFGFWAGPAFSGGETNTKIRFATNGEGYSIAGTVKGIDEDAVTKSGQCSRDSVRNYAFEWTFGLGDFYSTEKDQTEKTKAVPVVSFVTDNVSKGFPAPKLTSVKDNGDGTIHLSWTPPSTENGQEITGYQIYYGDLDGQYTKVSGAPAGANDSTYDFEAIGDSNYYSFVVTAVGKNTRAASKTMESLPSNTKSIIYTPIKPVKKTITIGVKEKTITYGEAVTLTKEDLILPDGIDQSDINMDNLSWSTIYTKGKNAGFYAVKANGLTSEKYLLTYQEGSIHVESRKITAENLTVSVNNKPFDDKTDATGVIKVNSDALYGTDTLRVVYDQAAFDSTAAGTGKLVTFTGLGLAGTKSDNYDLTVDQVTGSGSITPAAAYVWAADGISQKHDGSVKNITPASYPGGALTVSYYAVNESGIIGGKVTEPRNIGRYLYVITFKGSSNYAVQDELSHSESDFVGKNYEELSASNIGIMTISGSPQENLKFEKSLIARTFGDESFTQTAIGGAAGSSITYEVTEGKDVVSVNAATGAVTIKKPGIAQIKATATADEFEPVSAFYSILVSKKQVELSIPESTELTYTGEDLDVACSTEDLVPGIDFEEDDLILSYTNIKDITDHSHKNAGQYYVNARISPDCVYYEQKEAAEGALVINKKSLIITPDDNQCKLLGEEDPVFTYTAEGLVKDDALTGSLGREEGETIGSYAFTLGTLKAVNDNYTLSLSSSSSAFTIIGNLEVDAEFFSNGIAAAWTPVNDADGYYIYVARWSRPFGKPVMTVSSDSTYAMMTRINGEKVSRLRNYKLYVAAYSDRSESREIICKSNLVHVGPVTDVTGHWAYDSIAEAYDKELFTGTSDSLFEPDIPMTRAMLATVLHRMEGTPEPAGKADFRDVEEDTWYTDAVAWASENGIVEGYGDGLFGTNDNITREQMATILNRYASRKGCDVSKTADLSLYEDAGEISSWALSALQWANAEQLITGRTETTLVPHGNATRAEVATILIRFSNNVLA